MARESGYFGHARWMLMRVANTKRRRGTPPAHDGFIFLQHNIKLYAN